MVSSLPNWQCTIYNLISHRKGGDCNYFTIDFLVNLFKALEELGLIVGGSRLPVLSMIFVAPFLPTCSNSLWCEGHIHLGYSKTCLPFWKVSSYLHYLYSTYSNYQKSLNL